MKKIELNSLDLHEIKDSMTKIGEKEFRGEQIFIYLNKHLGEDINKITGLSREVKDKVDEIFYINKIFLYKKFESKIDDTVKYLFLLEDNNLIETVKMKHQHGISICVSTQVGCRMGCGFCASTKGGLVRNLTPSEILNQVYYIQKDIGEKITNIVLMGSGEPLDNYDNVLKFLNIIHNKKGQNLSYRNITLSSCGIVPKIYKLADEKLPITLSISLHSPFEDRRREIMPISKSYSIKSLMEACKHYEKETGRRISFEYTLILGENNRDEDIKELTKILNGLNCHINLIPLNPIKEYEKDRPNKSKVEEFHKKLLKNNINTTIRREKGGDISASCGQLRRDYLDKE